MKKSQLIVADADILPEVFTKVIEVKRLIVCKDEKSLASKKVWFLVTGFAMIFF